MPTLLRNRGSLTWFAALLQHCLAVCGLLQVSMCYVCQCSLALYCRVGFEPAVSWRCVCRRRYAELGTSWKLAWQFKKFGDISWGEWAAHHTPRSCLSWDRVRRLQDVGEVQAGRLVSATLAERDGGPSTAQRLSLVRGVSHSTRALKGHTLPAADGHAE